MEHSQEAQKSLFMALKTNWIDETALWKTFGLDGYGENWGRSRASQLEENAVP